MSGRVTGRVNHVGQVEFAPHPSDVRAHLKTIIESRAFKGSRRSQEFLQFIVERVLDHGLDGLKERTLGVELFGRAPSYDTGEDAIVRVTACDVRKRLHQFYTEFGRDCEFRIELPTGSYIAEFHQLPAAPAEVSTSVETVPLPSPAEPASSTAKLPVEAGTVEVRQAVPAMRRRRPLWLMAAGVTVALLFSAIWFWNEQRVAAANSSPVHALPWSALIQPNRDIRVVFCDPEIVMVQSLLDYSVSLSDYANQHYWPAEMKPEIRKVFQSISFRGVSTAAVDTALSLRIENMLVSSGKRPVQMQTARSLRLTDFKTEDSFVLFGSPRSNPWVELFKDQLDFNFEFDPARRAEFVRNRRPQGNEPREYVPTAEGWGTGQAYAIIALVGNPDQSGQVLLLAGSNAEATEAAGKLTTNTGALSQILSAHGINPAGPGQHFEILLRVSTMAGSPNTFDVIACHALTNRPGPRT